MSKESDICYIRSRLKPSDLLMQLAEECAELAQASLKLARILEGRNPTPVSEKEANTALMEEIADVFLCLELCGIEVGVDVAINAYGDFSDCYIKKQDILIDLAEACAELMKPTLEPCMAGDKLDPASKEKYTIDFMEKLCSVISPIGFFGVYVGASIDEMDLIFDFGFDNDSIQDVIAQKRSRWVERLKTAADHDCRI